MQKGLEEVGYARRLKAGAGVGDAELDPPGWVELDRDLDRASRRREADGVGDHVGYGEGQPVGINGHVEQIVATRISYSDAKSILL